MTIQKPDWFDVLLEWLTPVTIHTRSLVFDFGDVENVPIFSVQIWTNT